MREIKFRGWSKRYKFMFLVTKLILIFKKSVYGDKPETSFKWNTIKLMQFTGLKDKNGKEIYEGDLLEINKGGKPFLVKDIRIDTLTIARMIKSREDKLRKFTPLKIIGNIYENPELIEVKKWKRKQTKNF